MESLTSLSSVTCSVIAQIMPVFLVALVAERIVFRRSESSQRRRLLLIVLRMFIDTAIAGGIVMIMLLAIAGVESNGLEGTAAEVVWFGFVFISIAVVYRWLLLSTPLLMLLNVAAQQWAEIAARAFDGFALGTGFVSTMLVRAVSVFSDVVFGLLTAGLISPVNSVASVVSRGIDSVTSITKK